jgi:hypothetical protein
MIIEAQLGLLTEGNTVLTFHLTAPPAISFFMTGAEAFLIPSGLIPSQPTTMTWRIAAGCGADWAVETMVKNGQSMARMGSIEQSLF